MSDYTKTTNFAAKDSLPSGNAAKIVKGTEIDTEFNNIATAVGTKLDTTGTAADSDKVDGFHISTASSGTDANTIYFRTTY